MVRGTVPSSYREDDQDALQSQEEAKSKKRRCVQSACVPCRKRKSKCDGSTPVCATCTAVYRTDCYYDPASEGRRTKSIVSTPTTTAGTKRDASVVSAASSGNLTSAEFVITSLRHLPDEQVLEFLHHLRKDPTLDIATLVDSWRDTVTLPPTAPFEVKSLETELSVLLGKPAVTLTGQSRHFGHSATLGLVVEDESYDGGRMRSGGMVAGRQGTTWTTVTRDLAFVEKLLNLYFTWSHPFYVLFSRECFYKDFRAGRDKYCSSLLVNVICAYACHLTDDPAGRTDPSNFRTAGDHFMAEAKRLLFEDETPSLTTTQALCLMGMREPSTGRDSPGFAYIGRCMRMCVELGLHLNNSASPKLGLTPSEIEVRKVTFWGCFTCDSVWSICTGRISQLPRAAITLDKPILEESADLPEAYPGASRVQPGTVTTRMFLQEFSTLSELINDNNYMFFAPKERITSTRLLACYQKYLTWYEKLPSSLRLEGKQQPEPHIIALHMLFHTIIVHLFRPMLKVDLIHSDVRPRAICIEAANKVSELTRIYRSLYSLRTAHLVIPHVLLSVSVVHLLYSKDNSTSRQNLVESLQGLEDIHVCHYFGARSFRIVRTLSKTWNLPWPDELRDSKLILGNESNKSQGTVSPPPDPLLVAGGTAMGNRMGTGQNYLPVGHPDRRQSLSMFAGGNLQLATHPATSKTSSVRSGQQHHHSPVVGLTPTPSPFDTGATMSSYSYSQSMASATGNTSTTTASPVADVAEAMFWSPMPGMPGPIIPRNNYQQISPMGLDSVLQSSDMGDRLGRDGFKMSEDWQSSHVNGFATNSGTGFAPPSSQASGAYLHLGSNASYAQPGGGVPYQQPPHNNHHRHATSQEEYEAGWWTNSTANPGRMS
ncbi:hypothetical protein P153DRAFT_368558 [Dothidotthia symphoricarpi CBS 119687]|uniref:Zn(2)-C6 fungal-type domain-containing protein n=1 Tax=Dothidotthia symphoricarpi CBS 119687 TaxID=1392245 RepID=A0A6A6A6P9_9PLEO|nr:uncharacterized protein P153DRAFT_368558 [Dothidotthia symphoricarpi CBS 119687]KAF2127236.1 hypothetical protein P153DRAFT_368558 [Dothidotthia symphoricarpi CBS 119687]